MKDEKITIIENKTYQKLTDEMYDFIYRLKRINNNSCFKIIFLTYLLLKNSRYKEKFGDELSFEDLQSNKLNLKNEMIYCIRDLISQGDWENSKELAKNFSSDDLQIIVLNYKKILEGEGRHQECGLISSDLAVEIAKRLLNINSKDKVADFCCGYGNFLSAAFKEEQQAEYYGIDYNKECKIIFLILSELLNKNFHFDLQDVFMSASKEVKNKFDKIFCDHPLRTDLANYSNISYFKKFLSEKYPGYFDIRNSEWIFNMLLCENLTPQGKAISFMLPSDTQMMMFTKTRRLFVEKGLIESVIFLPSGIFSYISIPLVMVVFSFNNSGVRIVDASRLGKEISRIERILNPDDIETIVNATKGDTDISKFVTKEELIKKDCVFQLYKYEEKFLNVKDGKPFESLILNIKRGTSKSVKELKRLYSDSATNYQFLNLNNIKDGIVDYEGMQYLTEIDKKDEKYCVKNNSLIISRFGIDFKFAIVSVKKGQYILPCGNLFCIELDERKILPYYLFSFFNSSIGKELLSHIARGTALAILPIDELKKMIISVPSLKEQEAISNKCQALLDEIQIYKKRILKANEELLSISDSINKE